MIDGIKKIRIRKFTVTTKKRQQVIFARAVAFFIMIALLLYVPTLIPNLDAANYTFVQSSWTGGATANVAMHDAVLKKAQQNWSEYMSADASLDAGTALGIKSTAGLRHLSSSTDFSGGVTNGVHIATRASTTVDDAGIRLIASSVNMSSVNAFSNDEGIRGLDFQSRLAVDDYGVVHFVYHHNPSTGSHFIQYMRTQPGKIDMFTTPIIITDLSETPPALVVDKFGVVYIFYKDATGKALRYAYCDPYKNGDPTDTSNSRCDKIEHWQKDILIKGNLDVKSSEDKIDAWYNKTVNIIHVGHFSSFSKTIYHIAVTPNQGDAPTIGDINEPTLRTDGNAKLFRVGVFKRALTSGMVIGYIDTNIGYRVTQFINGDWTTLETPLEDATIGSSDSGSSVAIAPDENSVYFTFYNDAGGGTAKTVYMTRCTNNPQLNCTPAVALDEPGNSLNKNGRYGAISFDKNEILHFVYDKNKIDGSTGDPRKGQTFQRTCDDAQSNCSDPSNWTNPAPFHETVLVDAASLFINKNTNEAYYLFPQKISTGGTANDNYFITNTFPTSNISYFSPVYAVEEESYVSWGSLLFSRLNIGGISVNAKSSSDAAALALDQSPGNFCTISSGQNLTTGGCVKNGDNYIKFFIIPSTNVNTQTPILYDLTLQYMYTPSSSTLISSPYNTVNPLTELSNGANALQWSESGGSAEFQLRTASTQTALSLASFIGPDGTSGTFYKNGTGECSKAGTIVSCSVPQVFQEGGDDQFFQYKAVLKTTGGTVPMIDDIQITYAVNEAPAVAIQGSIQQSSGGQITVPYTHTDADNNFAFLYLLFDVGVIVENTIPQGQSSFALTFPSGVLPSNVPQAGVIQIEKELMQYNGFSGTTINITQRGFERTGNVEHAVDSGPLEVFFNANNATNSSGALISGPGKQQQPTGNSTIYWNPSSEILSTFAASAKVRVVANDYELVNQIGLSNSNTFNLDTKDPTVGADPISITSGVTVSGGLKKTNNPAGTVDITLSASDDSLPLSMNMNNAGYESYATQKSGYQLSAGDGLKTVSVSFKDGKGNETGLYSDIIDLDRTPPQVPTGLDIVEVSNESTGEVLFFVNWAPISNPIDGNGLNDFKQYHLYRSADGSSYLEIAQGQLTDVDTHSYIDSVCSAASCVGNTYYYKLTSEDNIENISADSAIKNVIATGESANVSAPTISNISIGTPGKYFVPISWTVTNSPADSAVAYLPAPATDFSSAPTITNPAYISAGASHIINIIKTSSISSGASYDFEVRSSDPSGNTATAISPSLFSFPTIDTTAPSIQGSLVKTDFPKTASFEFTANEPALALIEHNSNYYGTSDFKTSHTIVLPTTLTPGSATPYSLILKDVNGNQSTVSGTISHPIAVDTTPPVITNINVAPSAFSALVTWDTNEAASSYVEYGTNIDGEGKAIYTHITGNRSFAVSPYNHSITLDRLNPGNTYYYRVRSVDTSGNEQISAQGSFTALTGTANGSAPSAFGVMVVGVSINTTLISYNTSIASESIVEYSQNSSFTNSLTRVIPRFSTTHAVELSGLMPGTLYYFRIRTKDVEGDVAGPFQSPEYLFATLSTNSADITISNVKVVFNETNTTVSWDTNEPTTGFVEYGFDTGYGQSFGESAFLKTNHSLTLPADLLGKITYNFRIRALAGDGRQAVSQELAIFTSPATAATNNAEDQTPPAISNVKVVLVTHDAAIISWTTNETASSSLAYGYTAAYGKYGTTTPEGAYNTSHTVTLFGLDPATTYYFQARSQDQAGNLGTKDQDTSGNQLVLTTKEKPKTGEEAIELIYDPGDTDPPQIVNVQIGSVTARTASTTWETNEAAASYVEYGTKSGVYNSISGEASDFVFQNNALLHGLSASTTYYFIVSAIDSSGNKGSSKEFTFTTKDLTDEELALEKLNKKLKEEADKREIDLLFKLSELASSTQNIIRGFFEELNLLPEEERDKALEIIYDEFIGPPRIIGSVPTVEVTDTSATITWQTIKETTTQIRYAPSNDYDEHADDPYKRTVNGQEGYTTEHTVTITGLTPFTEYHYQLAGSEKVGRIGISIDRKFKTLPIQPKFVSAGITSKSEKRVTFEWETNILTNGFVSLVNQNTEKGYIQNSEIFLRNHKVTFENLDQDTLYYAYINAVSEDGVTIRSNRISFTTKPDDVPPIISLIRSKLSLVPGKKDIVQAVITWTTDETATGLLKYAEGGILDNSTARLSDEQRDLGLKHVIVLSNLKPATIYTFRAVSVDAVGNQGISKEYKIFTPRKEQSVFELIIKNFEDTFGFLKDVH